MHTSLFLNNCCSDREIRIVHDPDVRVLTMESKEFTIMERKSSRGSVFPMQTAVHSRQDDGAVDR